MKNNVFVKVFACLLVVVTLLLSIPISTSAADAKMIDYSDVMADLEKYGIDKTKYQLDRDAKHIRMLYFLEYGYDYYGNTSDYGLYVYIWNPTGVPIDTSEAVYGKNFIEMQVRSNLGEVQHGFVKYKLKLCSYSTEQGYEHLFYKFKIEDVKTVCQKLDKHWRQYDISGIELSRSGDKNPTDYGISQLITCTGFMPYHDAGKVAKSTYQSQGVDRVTVELELHPATWKTSTSDKGEGYQYEMFSTYFSVPNDIIRDYGDTANVTKGLVEVDGTFEEYKVGGIITSHQELYDLVLPYLHKKVPYNANKSEAVPFWFYSAFREGVDQGPDVSFNQTQELGYQLNSEKTLPYITNVIKYSGYMSEFTPEETRNWIYEQIKFEENSEFLPWVDDGCTFGFQHYSVANEDKNGNKIDLGKEMASFADSYKRGKLLAWLEGVGSLVDGSKTYSGIKPIRVVSAKDVDNGKTDAAIGEDLFVEAGYVDDIQAEVNSATSKNKTTYLIRYAVRDYYCEDINVGTKDASAYGWNDGNYYFEKTIFHNFDVLSLTYENKFGDRTVIPVVSSPIDNFGTITPPAGSDEFDPGSGDDNDPVGCQVVNYRPIVIIVGVLIACILINFVLSIFGLNIGKVLKWLWKVISWPFRKLWKGLKALFKSGKKRKPKKPKEKPKKRKKSSDDSELSYHGEYLEMKKIVEKKEEERKKNDKKEI